MGLSEEPGPLPVAGVTLGACGFGHLAIRPTGMSPATVKVAQRRPAHPTVLTALHQCPGRSQLVSPST